MTSRLNSTATALAGRPASLIGLAFIAITLIGMPPAGATISRSKPVASVPTSAAAGIRLAESGSTGSRTKMLLPYPRSADSAGKRRTTQGSNSFDPPAPIRGSNGRVHQ